MTKRTGRGTSQSWFSFWLVKIPKNMDLIRETKRFHGENDENFVWELQLFDNIPGKRAPTLSSEQLCS